MRTFFFFIIAFLGSSLAYTQAIDGQSLKPNPSAPITVDSATIDSAAQVKIIHDLFDSLQNNDDRLNFPGLVSGLINLTGKNGSTATFQATLYALRKIFTGKPLLDLDYERNWFLRNMQINLGLTPDSKSILNTPTDGQMGFTLAILNNKELSQEDFKESLHTASDTLWGNILQYITIYKQNLSDHNQTQKVIDMNSNLISKRYDMLPSDLLDSIKVIYHIKNIDSNFFIPGKLVNSMEKSLAKRPLLTIDFNSIYGFPQDEWNSLTAKTHFSIYFLKELDPDPSWSTDVSISEQNDTVEKTKNLDREILNISSGLVFGSWTISLIKLDVKLNITDNQILTTIHGSEKRNDDKATINPILTIDKVTIPVTIDYDFNTKKWSGTWKVQF